MKEEGYASFSSDTVETPTDGEEGLKEGSAGTTIAAHIDTLTLGPTGTELTEQKPVEEKRVFQTSPTHPPTQASAIELMLASLPDALQTPTRKRSSPDTGGRSGAEAELPAETHPLLAEIDRHLSNLADAQQNPPLREVIRHYAGQMSKEVADEAD